MSVKAETMAEPATSASPNTAESPPSSHPATSPEATPGEPQPEATTPLTELFAALPQIIKDAEHQEMWGVELTDPSNVPTTIVLTKFLRANNNDVAKTKTQLTDALKWRKEMQPLKLLADTEHSKEKFGDLGFVTTYTTSNGRKEIVTWNVYGAAKDIKGTFGNVDEYELVLSSLMPQY
jgi:hypothetical protein